MHVVEVLGCWHCEGSSAGAALTLLRGALCDPEHRSARRPSQPPAVDNSQELLFPRKKVQRLCVSSSLKQAVSSQAVQCIKLAWSCAFKTFKSELSLIGTLCSCMECFCCAAVVHSSSSRDQRWLVQHRWEGGVRGNCHPKAGSPNQPGGKERQENKHPELWKLRGVGLNGNGTGLKGGRRAAETGVKPRCLVLCSVPEVGLSEGLKGLCHPLQGSYASK